MRNLPAFLSIALATLIFFATTASSHAEITLTKEENQVRVECDGELFTNFIFKGYAKPILYPVLGPGQTPMTRNWPMKEVDGEAKDHPHHKSIWFTHDGINGSGFWHENGKVRHQEFVSMDDGGERPSLTTRNTWFNGRGETVLTDTMTVRFLEVEGGRAIDFKIELIASHGDVKIADTKEGTMAIRTHPNLRLTAAPQHGVPEVNGQAVNSNGTTGKAIWGEAAKWVDYYGTINDNAVGIAIMDHPSNLRHPTTWHARDYGLIAANPFGLSHFQGKPAGTGEYTIPSGESLTLRYRFVFHEGDATSASVERLYEDFAGETE